MAVKPNLALIPSGVKASKVYSVLPSDGVGDFDFTRSGSATRINKNGLIETVASNVPRLNYPLIDGVVSGCPSLLLEPARTNLVTNYNDFTSWVNSGSYITANYGISPDGSQNASRCLFTNTNQALSKNIGTNGTLSYSIYVKGVKGETINISMASGSDNSFTLNGEWQRLSYSDTVTNSTLNINTFGGKTARDLLIFGVQLEAGSYSTSLIPTSGSTATRSAETCEQNLSNQVSLTEGVFYVDVTNLGRTQNANILTQNSTSNSVYGYIQTNNRIVFGLFANSVSVPITSSLEYEIGTRTKIAFHYKSGNSKLYVNGSLVGNSTDTFTLGSSFGDGIRLIDNASSYFAFPEKSILQEFKIYNTALTDQELINLTKI